MNRPFVLIAPVFAAGIAVSAWINPMWLIPAALLGVLFVLYFLFKKNSGILVLSFFLLGALIYSVSASVNNSSANLGRWLNENPDKKICRFNVFVSGIPVSDGISQYFDADIISAVSDGSEISGLKGGVRIKVKTENAAAINYGDILLINASLRRPGRARNGFDYGEYLKRNGIYALCYTYSGAVTVAGHGKGNMFYDLSFRARQKYIDIIYASMPRAEAMMMDGIMLGNKKVIAPDIFDDFKKTGTAHILAVSGMNASLIAMFIFVMLKLFGVKRRYSALLTIIFILIFTVITGAQASIIRAAVMASFVLAGYIFEREPDTMNSLAIAAFFIMLFNPASIFDTGFLLSFLATMGLIYLNKKAASYFVFIPKWASVGLVTTVTAQIFIVPVMINTFGYISLISVAANVLVVPLAEFLTIAGFAMWAAGLVSAGAARIFGASCWIMVKAMLFVCAKLAAVPFAAVSTVAMPGIFMVFYYLYFILWPHDDVDIKIKGISGKAVLAVTLLAWYGVLSVKAFT